MFILTLFKPLRALRVSPPRFTANRFFVLFSQTQSCSNSFEENYEKKLYEQRSTNESIDKKKARLIYQSRKRGILENDLLLASFAKKHLDNMNPDELNEYDRLINTASNEWDIYYWAVGTKETPVEFRGEVMNKLAQHTKNEGREQRFRQPDLNFSHK